MNPLKLSENPKNWYVLEVKVGTEKKVSNTLLAQGFEAFVPTEKVIRQRSDRKIRIQIAIFSGYVFVCVNELSRYSVFIVKNIKKYVQINGKVCILQPEDIDLIRKMDSFGSKIVISLGRINKGREVEILSGVFLGYRGVVKEDSSSRKIRIEIATLNVIAEIELINTEIKVL